jgi:uncharacterized protein HemX
MTPYTLLGGLLLWAASVGAAGWWAYGQGRDTELAAQYREGKAAEKAGAAAAEAAASAIAQIEVKQVTIRQQLQREVKTREIFRDCRSGDDARRMLNNTPGIAAEPASGPGGGRVPGARTLD